MRRHHRALGRPCRCGPASSTARSNAAPMSAFADRRSYLYKGETIDRQTHLGYDLASLQNAHGRGQRQDGVVVFAGYLGIYGNTVVIDHGLGIFSLYGHLSSDRRQSRDRRCRRARSIGQTGETGLAGGDHLHFSILLRGVQVDPVEWWDPQWMREHLADQLERACRPRSRRPPPSGASAGTRARQRRRRSGG